MTCVADQTRLPYAFSSPPVRGADPIRRRFTSTNDGGLDDALAPPASHPGAPVEMYLS